MTKEKFQKIIEKDGKTFKEVEGKMVEVKNYKGFGWLTREELFKLRQDEPRIAP
ncbi:MAG: hypothetical protein OEV93_03265 [Candidatus Moranbacteria bacterium]|nr:hypothetical protein [Candidatus Moranbacteria bacterium]